MQVSTIPLRLPPLLPVEKCELGDVLYELISAGVVKEKIEQPAAFYCLFKNQLPEKFASQHVYNAISQLLDIDGCQGTLTRLKSKYKCSQQEFSLQMVDEQGAALWDLGVHEYSNALRVLDKVQKAIPYFREAVGAINGNAQLKQLIQYYLNTLECTLSEILCL